MPNSHHSQQQEQEMRGTKFPQKLYDFLELATSDEKLSDIVSWLPDGRSFNVHDPVSFTERILPAYFGGMNHYRSFRRQLNLYGIYKRIERSRYKRIERSRTATASSSIAENHHDHHQVGSIRIDTGKIPLEQRGESIRPAPPCSDSRSVAFFMLWLRQLVVCGCFLLIQILPSSAWL